MRFLTSSAAWSLPPRRRMAISATVTGVCLALTGCGGGGAPGTTASPASPAPTVAATSEPASTGTSESGAGGACRVPASSTVLSECLVIDLPAGYRRQPDGAAKMGYLNLDQAARDDEVGTGQKRFLQDAGYVRGYKRLWHQAHGKDAVTIFVYQFGTAEGSRKQLDRWVGQLVPRSSHHFAVEGLPDAVGLDRTNAPQVSWVLYTVGPIAFAVTVESASLTTGHADAAATARAQVARLQR